MSTGVCARPDNKPAPERSSLPRVTGALPEGVWVLARNCLLGQDRPVSAGATRIRLHAGEIDVRQKVWLELPGAGASGITL